MLHEGSIYVIKKPYSSCVIFYVEQGLVLYIVSPHNALLVALPKTLHRLCRRLVRHDDGKTRVPSSC